MIVYAAIVDGPLTQQALSIAKHAAFQELAATGNIGAYVNFEGIVRLQEPRPDSGGELQRLCALDYETYDPMAQRRLESLAQEISAKFSLHSILVLHSRGSVKVGEISFILEIGAAHRAEAIEALTEFIDRMKQDVPIWKKPVWAS